MWVPTLSAGSVHGVDELAAASEVTVGSCATGARESGQARKGAAFSGIVRAPQIAWPSPHSSRLFFFTAAMYPASLAAEWSQAVGRHGT